ncbi:MAG: DinB family protein [Gemmatimonadetes bacterium]|nr:DinB family protein [Gemmatimonadota bacterium]
MAQIQNPQLAELATKLEGHMRLAQAVAGGLSPAQLAWQASPESWGVAQCLEHLVFSIEANELPVPSMMAAAGKPATPSYSPWKSGWFGGFIIKGATPGSRAVKTRRKFVPVTVRPDVLRRWVEKHELLMKWIRMADGLDVTRIRVPSPIVPFLSYHLGDSLTINVIHAERHLRQAERVKTKPGFPKA